MPGGLSWGLNNDDAGMPSGWRNDLLDFKKFLKIGCSSGFLVYFGGRSNLNIKDWMAILIV